jgi:hypothetical protein
LLDCHPGGRCRARALGGVVRQQDQENFRADADTSAAKTPQELDDPEEKRGRGKNADASAVANSGEIAVVCAVEKEKSLPESQSRREAPAGHVPFAGKKEDFAHSGTGFFAEPFPKEEKKTQTFSFTESDGISHAFFEPDRHSRIKRNARRHTVTFAIAEKERSAGDHPGQRHRGL